MIGEASEDDVRSRDPQREDGYVSILTHPNFAGQVKIGRSNNPADRLKTYQCGCPLGAYAMPFILRTSNACGAESKAHQLLKDYRLEGEWFSVSLDTARNVVAHACAVQEGSSGNPALEAELVLDDRQHLRQRGSTWYVRVAVPRRLWARLGKQNIVRTLRTCDLAEAIKRRGEVLQQIRTELARHDVTAATA